MRLTKNGLGLPEYLTSDEALEWAMKVLAARRHDWYWTEREGLSEKRLETEKYLEAWDEAAITALAKLWEGKETPDERPHSL